MLAYSVGYWEHDSESDVTTFVAPLLLPCRGGADYNAVATVRGATANSSNDINTG